MRNLIKLMSFISAIMVFVSCTKHAIEYDAVDLGKDMAEYQLHYFVPVVAGAANNIYKVEVNNQLVANTNGPLNTYNAIPSGAVGRFFSAPSGNTNIKLYLGTDEQLVYDENCTLQPGKQNIFVHDFSKPPVVISNEYPYPKVITDTTAKVAWVRFYNFLYETAGVPTALKLQYQYQYNTDPGNAPHTNQMSDWLNLGDAVAFGEATSWEEVPVIKHPDRYISAGTERIDYRIKVIGANGEDLGILQVRNAAGSFVNYSDWWNATIGRVYHHIMSGMRAAVPTSAVRVFTAL